MMTRAQCIDIWMHGKYHREVDAGRKATFTVHEYAEDRGISVEEASGDIQAYQAAQRGPNSRRTIFYVLTRVIGTRTANAQWRILSKVKDANLISMADVDDAINRIDIATIKDLTAIAEKSPRSRRPERISRLMHAAAEVMKLAAQGINDDDE
jgi:hypothetical protein